MVGAQVQLSKSFEKLSSEMKMITSMCQYVLRQGKRKEAKKIVLQIEEEGAIVPFSSSWTSPVIDVKNKNWSTRFCVDYSQLNNVLEKNGYPVPRIDNEYMDALVGSTLFSNLDLKTSYWQIDVDPVDHKIAFTPRTGYF